MATNAGFLLIAGLGALLLLGRRTERGPMETEEIIEDIGSSTAPVVVASTVADDGTAALVTLDVAVANMGETITPTELVVRRSEQIKKQAFDWAANAAPSATSGKVSKPGPSQGDIDSIEMAQGTYVFGGASRPTSTAIPVWNNKYGWYWVDPPTGRAVGPGGKLWSPNDTSVHRGAPGVNIGQKLPPGWTANRGGSADFTGTQETLAYEIGF